MGVLFLFWVVTGRVSVLGTSNYPVGSRPLTWRNAKFKGNNEENDSVLIILKVSFRPSTLEFITEFAQFVGKVGFHSKGGHSSSFQIPKTSSPQRPLHLTLLLHWVSTPWSFVLRLRIQVWLVEKHFSCYWGAAGLCLGSFPARSLGDVCSS